MIKRVFCLVLCFLVFISTNNITAADNNDQVSKEKVLEQIADKIPFPDEINSLVMKKDKKLQFIVKKDDKNQEWKVIKPFECNGDSFGITVLIAEFATTEDYELIDENPRNLAEYGLSNPEYTFEYGTGKGVTKLYLGKRFNNKTKIYATLDNKKVFAISLNSNSIFDNPLKDVVDPFAYLVHIKYVSKLVVKFDNKVVNCIINSSDDYKKDTFTVNGKNANVKDEKGNDLFRLFYMSVIGVTLNNIEMGAVPKGKPEITFTYTLKIAPYKMVVEFISKDKNYYYIMRNGKYSNFVVLKNKFNEPDGLRESYKNMMKYIK